MDLLAVVATHASARRLNMAISSEDAVYPRQSSDEESSWIGAQHVASCNKQVCNQTSTTIACRDARRRIEHKYLCIVSGRDCCRGANPPTRPERRPDTGNSPFTPIFQSDLPRSPHRRLNPIGRHAPSEWPGAMFAPGK